MLLVVLACGSGTSPTTAPSDADVDKGSLTSERSQATSSSSNGAADTASVSAASPESTTQVTIVDEPLPQLVPDAQSVPPVDTSISSVAIDEIVFDTFDGSFVRLSEASDELIEGLRDAIQPIYNPGYGNPDSLDWLLDTDVVIGYVTEEEAYAYPIKVLNSHELVNDFIGGTPVLISYCPLCASGVVYRRQVGSDTLVFGNTSALYQSDLVMYDHQTGSYWLQVSGEAIVGPATGQKLELLSSQTMPWGRWKELHPNTRLLRSLNPEGASFSYRRYGEDPFAGYQRFLEEGSFAFPVSKERIDGRLGASELVLVVEVREAARAYPLQRMAGVPVNDSVGGRPVVVFSQADSLASAAFIADAEGTPLTFKIEDGKYIDIQTGSTWNLAGEATSGSMRGIRLEPAPLRRAFWFSISLTLPDVEVYNP